MAEYRSERRQSPRFGLRSHTISVVTRHEVRVLDIGSGGVLMTSERGLTAGEPGLHMSLAGGRFSAVIRLRHSRVLPDSAVQFGGAFEDMTSESRQSLERFLGRAAR